MRGLMAQQSLQARLCARVEAGETIRDAARRCGVSRSYAWELIAAIGDEVQRKRRRAVDVGEHRRIIQLIEAGKSRGEVAQCLNRSKSVIQFHITRDAEKEIDAPRRIRSPIRCPDCRQLIFVVPCVSCLAKQSRMSG